MKKLIIFFVIFLIAVFVGLFMHADTGYVLIAYKAWSLETSLWILLLGILLLYLILHFVFAIFRRSRAVSGKFRTWSENKQHQKILQQTNNGLILWLEGTWEKSEQQLARAAKKSETPLLNYLIAARAAQEQGKYDKRDSYLRKAHKSTEGAEVAVGLTQAQLQLEAQQLERTLATLRHLQQIAPKHKYVMRLLQHTYVLLHDWHALSNLLPQLKKQRVLMAEELAKLEQQTYIGLLELAIESRDLNKLQTVWHNIPTKQQFNPAVLVVYAKALLQYDDKQQETEKLIVKCLRQNWDDILVELYGLISVPANTGRYLTTAEGWLKYHKGDAALLLCLGRICRRQQLWGKAKNYLEDCLAVDDKNRQAYYELAQLMETENQKDVALQYYKKGLVV